MSNDLDKLKHGRRLQKDKNAINKQIKIARNHGVDHHDAVISQPNRLNKHHVMDCGNPGCMLCGNPRRNKALKDSDKLTAQERRIYQDLDSTRDKKSNGLKIEDENG